MKPPVEADLRDDCMLSTSVYLISFKLCMNLAEDSGRCRFDCEVVLENQRTEIPPFILKLHLLWPWKPHFSFELRHRIFDDITPVRFCLGGGGERRCLSLCETGSLLMLQHPHPQKCIISVRCPLSELKRQWWYVERRLQLWKWKRHNLNSVNQSKVREYVALQKNIQPNQNDHERQPVVFITQHIFQKHVTFCFCFLLPLEDAFQVWQQIRSGRIPVCWVVCLSVCLCAAEPERTLEHMKVTSPTAHTNTDLF